ncbi:MAG TPA: hypothetical protein VFT23_14635 [Burkholderiales bacterium]|nr:hypothetical protein [Burkholderiales bacterium]
MKLVATSVVRGSHQGESHGGVYLIDLDAREVRQLLDWNTANIDWQGRGWDRGLRGIAFDGETVYVAASDELFAYTPDFHPVGSWRNAYLKHCHEIAVWERRLFLASTGFDTILGFDLDAKAFSWGMHVVRQQYRYVARGFDPRKDDGPLMLNKLHLNNVHCTRGGMYLSGMRTGGMLLFNGREVQMAVELPHGTHNARPFRDGVLFNDTGANLLRYAGRGDGSEDRAMKVPDYPPESLLNRDMDQSGLARQGFARGLAVLAEGLVAGGSSPSTVSVYDLPRNERVLSVNLTMDVRNAIHGLEVWPY